MRNEAMYAELLDLLTTDAGSGKEALVADKVAAKLAELGFQVIRDNAGETFGGECGNVLGIREGELDGSLLLSSHLDRVPNGYGIKPVEKDGVLYSDGTTILAADDISGVAAIFDGLRRVLATGKPLPRLEVLFTVGEETGLYGAKALDLSLIKSKMGYIFDSPGGVGRFVNGAPGRYTFRVDITGKSAHAGNEPEKGVDATKTVCDILSTLIQGRVDEITTSNFSVIGSNATALNVVCDGAWFEGEARSRDFQRLEEYVAYFEDHCKKVAAEKGAGIQITKEEIFRPFLIPESDPILVIAKAACEKLGLNFRAETGGGGMDANVYNAKDMVTVGVATGYTKNHTKAEQLVLEDFFKSGELAAVLIETFAEGLKAK